MFIYCISLSSFLFSIAPLEDGKKGKVKHTWAVKLGAGNCAANPNARTGSQAGMNQGNANKKQAGSSGRQASPWLEQSFDALVTVQWVNKMLVIAKLEFMHVYEDK